MGALDLKKLRRLFRDEETHFVELSRHFSNRFFDAEFIVRRSEPGTMFKNRSCAHAGSFANCEERECRLESV